MKSLRWIVPFIWVSSSFTGAGVLLAITAPILCSNGAGEIWLWRLLFASSQCILISDLLMRRVDAVLESFKEGDRS